MAFVVDAADWKLDGKSPQEALAAIDRFLSVLGDALDAGTPIWFGEEFNAQPVLGDEILWGLMRSDSPLPLPKEVWDELAVYLTREEFYTLDANQPQGFPGCIDIAVGEGLPTPNKDVAWAHHSVRLGRAVGCVGLWRIGVHQTTSTLDSVPLHWVGGQPSVAEFWRAAIDIEGNSLAVFERIAPRAYPKLHFFGNVLHSADDFVGGYHQNAPELKRHLSILNDVGHWAFTGAPPAEDPDDAPGADDQAPSNQLVQRRFQRQRVDIAPENPNVKQHRRCRVAREVTLSGKVLYCEWHCKLQGHQNRIHVHKPVDESDGKVVVAIFAEHLPLPGG